MNKQFLLLATVSSLLLTACGSGGTSNEIQIDGSSTVYPITEAVAEEYRSASPETRVTIGVSGTGGGFQKFLRGETDINNASRDIQPSEVATAEENGIDYLRLSVAFDGLAVLVHPDNDWVDYFTVEELHTIWEPEAQGSITRWNQVRSGWPDEEMHLYGPGVASGTYDYFTEVVVGEAGSSRGDFTASEDDNVLVQGVSTDPYALGFFGLAYYEENSERLRLVPVKDGEGAPVEPSMQTVSNGTYTPLSRPLFIYVSENAVQKAAVRDFVRFYLEHAGELSRQVGYVPMPDSAYRAELDRFNSFADSVNAE
ncbi:MAG: PstS family phosphate ABC transporter substrate-binding protein [Balneolaceae bacterium]|nr:PstS family phosphate ABC transporter substrate-binding protein [Balneolaceae bacterium]